MQKSSHVCKNHNKSFAVSFEIIFGKILTWQVNGEIDWARGDFLPLSPKSSVWGEMPELGCAVVLSNVPVLNMVKMEHKRVPVCALYTTLFALISSALLYYSPVVHADQGHSTVLQSLCWTLEPIDVICHLTWGIGKNRIGQLYTKGRL